MHVPEAPGHHEGRMGALGDGRYRSDGAKQDPRTFEIQWSSIALLWYDFALTFPAEVKYIWGSRLRTSTQAVWALLAGTAPILTSLGPLFMWHIFLHSCDHTYKFVGALSVLGRAAIIFTFTGRVYAIWSGNRYVLVYLGVIGLACIVLDIIHVPGLRCVGAVDIPISKTLLKESFERISQQEKSAQTFRRQRSLRDVRKMGLLYLVFEQGVIYFLLVSVLTVTSLILNIRDPNGFVQRLLNAITLPLSCTLTARFLLDIRQWDEKHRSTLGSSSRSTSLSFSSWSTKAVLTTLIEEFGEDPVARMATETVSTRAHLEEGRVVDDDDTLRNEISQDDIELRSMGHAARDYAVVETLAENRYTG
ncbi:hypothetical protein EIP91_008150 [Steccherinum ochraceum]|uniref:DUF6533 domain-containing protein n=1 Tax=Steccherinum ochraceum TaxID=92696 RepID=A0A4R0R5L2_9APHY|nr:hypothetical protein EIP91_008150 [Steccherinum ochraceum]